MESRFIWTITRYSPFGPRTKIITFLLPLSPFYWSKTHFGCCPLDFDLMSLGVEILQDFAPHSLYFDCYDISIMVFEEFLFPGRDPLFWLSKWSPPVCGCAHLFDDIYDFHRMILIIPPQRGACAWHDPLGSRIAWVCISTLCCSSQRSPPAR